MFSCGKVLFWDAKTQKAESNAGSACADSLFLEKVKVWHDLIVWFQRHESLMILTNIKVVHSYKQSLNKLYVKQQ